MFHVAHCAGGDGGSGASLADALGAALRDGAGLAAGCHWHKDSAGLMVSLCQARASRRGSRRAGARSARRRPSRWRRRTTAAPAGTGVPMAHGLGLCISPMKEGARVHHSYGSYAPSTYGSYEPRRANPSTGHRSMYSRNRGAIASAIKDTRGACIWHIPQLSLTMPRQVGSRARRLRALPERDVEQQQRWLPALPRRRGAPREPVLLHHLPGRCVFNITDPATSLWRASV
jgi:hypothetical protein